MASKIGMSYRNEAAIKRIREAVRSVKHIPPYPEHRRDPILQETLRLEWTAGIVEALAAAKHQPTHRAAKAA